MRSSRDLVEAAFDGDIDGVKDWIEKGYDAESSDGHDHTALSEAAVQVCAALSSAPRTRSLQHKLESRAMDSPFLVFLAAASLLVRPHTVNHLLHASPVAVGSSY